MRWEQCLGPNGSAESRRKEVVGEGVDWHHERRWMRASRVIDVDWMLLHDRYAPASWSVFYLRTIAGLGNVGLREEVGRSL